MCWNAAANFPIIPNKHWNAAKKRGAERKSFATLEVCACRRHKI